MRSSSLLICLAPLLFLLATGWPLAGAYVSCDNDGGHYAANSTYEANLRRLAAVVSAAAAASPGRFVDRAVGYWPNRPRAVTSCRSHRGDDCASCIAYAFKTIERLCPLTKEATFLHSRNRTCYLSLEEISIFGHVHFEGNVLRQMFGSALVFQAIGFAWLLFLLLQEWRGRKKSTTMLSNPLLGGDA